MVQSTSDYNTKAGGFMKLNRLIPELSCTNFENSKKFYTGTLGFKLLYERLERSFAMLDCEGANLMIEQSNGNWQTGELTYPLGRGINFQIQVSDVEALHISVQAKGWPIFVPMEERWYRANDKLLGNKQFLIQDPDGYLLRFFQDLGTKPVTE
jgi:catechol 2,3-dioxygenase-like lactoylglutathione lyase family enzyme